ncbi:MAG: hypothetical protein ABIH42_03880, partial [Planctomycetota bacterium]
YPLYLSVDSIYISYISEEVKVLYLFLSYITVDCLQAKRVCVVLVIGRYKLHKLVMLAVRLMRIARR